MTTRNWSDLPLEVKGNIFHCIDQQDHYTLSQCLSVCKNWSSLIDIVSSKVLERLSGLDKDSYTSKNTQHRW